VESIIVVDLDDDEKIVKLLDQWNGNEPPTRYGALLLRRANGKLTPWLVIILLRVVHYRYTIHHVAYRSHRPVVLKYFAGTSLGLRVNAAVEAAANPKQSHDPKYLKNSRWQSG
jgi:hypothetical protein